MLDINRYIDELRAGLSGPAAEMQQIIVTVTAATDAEAMMVASGAHPT
jgi:hypothetical protein